MTLFDEPLNLESLLARIEALEAKLMDKPVRQQTDCPPEIRQAWDKWCQHKAGKGWTGHARKLNLIRLVQLSCRNGEKAEKIVDQSIERGWTGLFEIRDDPKSASSAVQAKTAKEAMKPTETPLERDIARARHDCHIGMIDTAERDRRIAEATHKHRCM